MDLSDRFHKLGFGSSTRISTRIGGDGWLHDMIFHPVAVGWAGWVVFPEERERERG